MIPFPDKKYQIIYADPPWSYNDKGTPFQKKPLSDIYPVMDLNTIKNLKVNEIADENCCLFLWTTMPMIPAALEVIKSWGFEYKTNGFVWVKKNKISDTWFWGLGNYTRSNPELCLFALKGRMRRVRSDIHSIVGSKIRKHSQKPKEVRDRIEKLFGDLPRIELFAREKTEGWDVWGDEVDKRRAITL